MSELPFAPASERNKHPILLRLQDILPVQGRLLEIGAGTGQHAAFFARHFAGLEWLASDRCSELEGLRLRVAREGPRGMPEPVALDVLLDGWPVGPFQAAYSANTAHIMPWAGAVAMFEGLATVLTDGAPFILYGPFNVNGAYTAPSNESFDADLKARDPAMGLRDRGDLEVLGRRCGLVLEQCLNMPANNFLLVFHRRPGLKRRSSA